MEKKYRDALFTGLKCGAVTTIVYLIYNIVHLWLTFTPAMRPYVNSITQPSATPYIGQLPMEQYITIILVGVSFAVTAMGYLAAGYYAIRSEKRKKYTTNYVVSIGAIAGIGAFVPFFVAYLIFQIATAVIGWPLSGLSPNIPILVQGVTFFGCLSLGIVVAAILSAAGAWGYAYFENRIKSAF